MKLARTCLALLALLASACGGPEPPIDTLPTVDFRLVLEPTDEGFGVAERLDHRGAPLPLGEAEAYHVRRAHATQDELGYPAVHVDLHSEDASRLKEFSARHKGRRVAIVVDGRVLTAPVVHDALPGSFVINGGAEGFTEEEVQRLVALLHAGK